MSELKITTKDNVEIKQYVIGYREIFSSSVGFLLQENALGVYVKSRSLRVELKISLKEKE